jgi:hypothetical protein
MTTTELERTETPTDYTGMCHLYVLPLAYALAAVPPGSKAVCGHVKESAGYEGEDKCVVCIELGQAMGLI